MSRPFASPSSALKRKRPESQPPGHADAEQKILDLIKSKKDSGIWTRDIKFETKIADNLVTKSIKSLLAKKQIKEVVNIQNKGKKHYMAVEYEPSKELSGGDFYANGALDEALIDVLRKVSYRYISVQKVGTVEGTHSYLVKNKVVNFSISTEQVGEILNSMVLDDEIIEVKSTGYGDYYSIPIGTTCYRVTGGGRAQKGPKLGAFAAIPCGVCPRIGLCTSDGPISPTTCVYYTKWLDIDF
ncbi:DNA-directed RNA polymerase III subunit rpc6 [Striga asiatica]|uniref:DNA-directed RNA polymerase III subunit rpc6 n=1 Tax=Striga asiatica TaxID=4170 RepID=A0A5A7P6F7_STRAF|nr:DNA-directed RNA polymerase III subunit rpc6 [Striga asiatica]